MPIIRPSSYRPPLFFNNGHLQTIYPNFFRHVTDVGYLRQRVSTPDGDFLDLDWSPVGGARVAVLAHGLEGNSTRSYVLGMVRALNRHGWDAVVWNFRGCSGEPNNKVRFYHSGDTRDLRTVLTHVLQSGRYEKAALIGFSLGGNVILKYLGEQALQLNPKIRAAVVLLGAVRFGQQRPEDGRSGKHGLHEALYPPAAREGPRENGLFPRGN